MSPSLTQNPPSNQSPIKGLISGYASYFNNIDTQGDQIAPGAFSRALISWRKTLKGPKMLWQHDVKQPIGVWTYLKEDNRGLFAQGKLALGTYKADEAYILLKEGVLDNLSIGFRTRRFMKDKKTGSRILLDIDLLEISLVTFGANSRATIHNIKTF